MPTELYAMTPTPVDRAGMTEAYTQLYLALRLGNSLALLPCSHPVCHRPARLWSGRGSGRQGGAPRWTNDLDALGRGCSALPGSMAGGMGAPTFTTMNVQPPTGPSIPEPERPRRRHRSDFCCVFACCCCAAPSGLRAGAGRRQERRSRRRAGARGER